MLTLSEWDRAIAVIPNGTMTLSKCPDRYVKGVYPEFIESGNECYVSDKNNKMYVDFICGLGPIILGYRNHAVDNAVIDSIQSGQVIFSLPHSKEVELAEKLKKHISCAEQSKFFKTGSDALTAAVKVCRAFTKRDHALVCGYHGWHDWFTIVNAKKSGIPEHLAAYISKFNYNDLQSLEDGLKKRPVACVVMEPTIYESPTDKLYLNKVISLAHQYGALVVFDEVVTGIRFGLAGAAGHFSAIPDLACFSKALGNGYPIATLCGKKEFMSVFERDDFFISGTFGGDLIGISAALAVINEFEKDCGLLNTIWLSGCLLKTQFNRMARGFDLPVECVGFSPRTMFKFPTAEHKGLFWQECAKRGVLFGYANFINTLHSRAVINGVLNVVEESLIILKKNWEQPKMALEGAAPVEVFR